MERFEAEMVDGRLLSLSEQLATEKNVNKQLRMDLEFSQNRERSAVAALKGLKGKFQTALIEQDELKSENDSLRFELAESRKKLQRQQTDDKEASSVSQAIGRAASQVSQPGDGDRSGHSSSSSSRRNSISLSHAGTAKNDAEKVWYLEQQVLSLTREKKQLMTHLHWLSRQRTDPWHSDDDSDRLDEKASRISLEEGNGISYQTQSSRISQTSSTGPCLVRSKRVECFSRSESADNGTNVEKEISRENSEDLAIGEDRTNDLEQESQSGAQGGKANPRQIVKRLRNLKQAMLEVRAAAVRNNDLCETIFQLSFQNIKHPNEPRSYSNWSSYDEEKISAWTYFVKPAPHPNWLQDCRFGYRSLESYPQVNRVEDNAPGLNCELFVRKKSSASSPELYPGKKKQFDNYPFQISKIASTNMAHRENVLLTRSLSDQQSKSLHHSSRSPQLVKQGERPVFSTLNSADESLVDDQSKSLQTISLGSILPQPPYDSYEEISRNRFYSTSSTLTGETVFSENLIS